jgi:hypothetical protein
MVIDKVNPTIATLLCVDIPVFFFEITLVYLYDGIWDAKIILTCFASLAFGALDIYFDVVKIFKSVGQLNTCEKKCTAVYWMLVGSLLTGLFLFNLAFTFKNGESKFD